MSTHKTASNAPREGLEYSVQPEIPTLYSNVIPAAEWVTELNDHQVSQPASFAPDQNGHNDVHTVPSYNNSQQAHPIVPNNLKPEQYQLPLFDAAQHTYFPALHDVFHVPGAMLLPTQATYDYLDGGEDQRWTHSFQPDPREAEIQQLVCHVPSGMSVVPDDAVEGEDGRTYHGYKEGLYYLPNDAEEQDRLDLQHAGLMLLFEGRHALSPIPQPFTGKALDIGTGTGIWALEFADLNPDCTVIGTDLSAIQPPNRTSKSLNCSFVREDAEEDDWLLGPSSEERMLFDYIHLRIVCLCFQNPMKVLQNTFNNLKPGGYVEYQDFAVTTSSPDGSHIGSATKLFLDATRAGGVAIGRDFLVAQKYKDMMREIGFVDIEEKRMLLPLGAWAADRRMKNAGAYLRADTILAFSSFGRLLRAAGMAEDEILRLRRLVVDELYSRTPGIYPGIPVHVVWGRKPFDWETRQAKKQRAAENDEDVKQEPEAGQGHQGVGANLKYEYQAAQSNGAVA